jgi:hypothetical protein
MGIRSGDIAISGGISRTTSGVILNPAGERNGPNLIEKQGAHGLNGTGDPRKDSPLLDMGRCKTRKQPSGRKRAARPFGSKRSCATRDARPEDHPEHGWRLRSTPLKKPHGQR